MSYQKQYRKMVKLRQKNRYSEVSYNKLFNNKDSGSESSEETELFIKNKPRRIEFQTVDKVVEEGDTLQSLAIRYGCSVGKLKRINNFHNENEMFAKRVIKVPHRPFTLALAGVHISGNSSPESHSKPSTNRLIDVQSLNAKLIENSVPKKESEVNEIIFNSHIIPKETDRFRSEIPEEISSERVYLVPQSSQTLLNGSEPVISKFSCNGADADISWKVLIACFVIFIVAAPLVYVFYVAEHLENFHHNHGS